MSALSPDKVAAFDQAAAAFNQGLDLLIEAHQSVTLTHGAMTATGTLADLFHREMQPVEAASLLAVAVARLSAMKR